jgi:rod shape-determining protein MreC
MNSPSRQPWQTITIVLIIAGVLALSLGGYLNNLTTRILSPFLSVQQWITVRYNTFQELVNAPSDITLLRQRNKELESEVTDLRIQVIELQQNLSEMEILSALLDFARTQPQNEYEAASVIAHDPSPFLQYIVINKGSDDGIRYGMPVISDQGLVGRVVAITSNASRVQLITDSSTSVNVRIQPAKTEAVMNGSVTGDLTLDLIPQDAAIQPGDLVFTSGLGGNYPSDILVGQVVNVRQQATALFQEASVQSVVDFTRLEIVLVIVNFKPVDITPLLPERETGQ